MISVLLPVYNTDVFSLVQELSHQIEENKLEAEIIVFDDYSEPSFLQKNQRVVHFANVFYKELDQNYGRIKIRQLLATAAKNEWLLFIDGDSKIIQKSFLHTYFTAIKNDVDVIVGGTVYNEKLPDECKKRLHWKYGKHRELITANKSKLRSNNFCIRKAAFGEVFFPDNITGYGHEDTWIGMQLERLQKRILCVYNPVLHEGIEDASVFLRKSLQALQNLFILSKNTSPDLLRRHVRLYYWFCLLKKYRLLFVIEMYYSVAKNTINKNLSSCYPSLFFFDIFRLYHFIQLTKREY